MADKKITRERFLIRTAEEAKRYSVWKKALRAILLILIVVIVATYVVTILYSKYGSYTVSVNKFDSNKYSLCLSEDPSFKQKIIRLNSKAATEITNISENDLPKNLNSTNGEHNGENYLAYTYYLKNLGQDTVTYEYNMFIANVVNHVDNAIRIRLYVDDDMYIDYAKTRSDGKGAENGTTEFVTNRTVVRNQIKDFKPNDITKFTVVIWLEGDDVDCVDELIGGSLKTDMVISVIESEMDTTKPNPQTTKPQQ